MSHLTLNARRYTPGLCRCPHCQGAPTRCLMCGAEGTEDFCSDTCWEEYQRELERDERNDQRYDDEKEGDL